MFISISISMSISMSLSLFPMIVCSLFSRWPRQRASSTAPVAVTPLRACLRHATAQGPIARWTPAQVKSGAMVMIRICVRGAIAPFWCIFGACHSWWIRGAPPGSRVAVPVVAAARAARRLSPCPAPGAAAPRKRAPAWTAEQLTPAATQVARHHKRPCRKGLKPCPSPTGRFECVDLQTDILNCGACGVSCFVTGQINRGQEGRCCAGACCCANGNCTDAMPCCRFDNNPICAFIAPKDGVADSQAGRFCCLPAGERCSNNWDCCGSMLCQGRCVEVTPAG
jgi:hypothetical protein